MISDIYFITVKDELVTNRDIAKMAYVVNGDFIDANDLDSIRKYANSCVGVIKEVNPSVEMCIKMKEKVKAIMIYRDTYPGISMVEAKEAVEAIEAKMKLGIL